MNTDTLEWLQDSYFEDGAAWEKLGLLNNLSDDDKYLLSTYYNEIRNKIINGEITTKWSHLIFPALRKLFDINSYIDIDNFIVSFMRISVNESSLYPTEEQKIKFGFKTPTEDDIQFMEEEIDKIIIRFAIDYLNFIK